MIPRQTILPQPSLRFYNHEQKIPQDNIVEELKEGLWEKYNIDNRLYNDAIGEMHIPEWKEVFPNFTPIMPGFIYNEATQQVEEERYKPEVREVGLTEFLNRSEQFFSRFEGKRIGVHLSGGLDSSLIIGLLNHFGIPFYLYGMVNERFEFRTERRIQDILAPLGVRTTYINLEEYPFYSALDAYPFHQIPDSYIKQIAAERKIVEAAVDDGVEIMLCGQGADTLFVDPIPKDGEGISYNIGNEFVFSWAADLVYRPCGVELISFYGEPMIIEAIHNLRRGQKDDVSKLWARHFFRDFLPRELSEYSYVADFNGLSMSGLELAKPTIENLFEEAYDLTHHSIFSPESTKKMRETNVFEFDYHMYVAYCARISIAVWLHALFEH